MNQSSFEKIQAGLMEALEYAMTNAGNVVVGKLDWHHGKAYLGPFLCAGITCRLSDPPQYSVEMQEDMDPVPGFFQTEDEARTAVVKAVQEAIR